MRTSGGLGRPFVERDGGLDGLQDLVFAQLPMGRRGQRGERGVVHSGNEAGGAGGVLVHDRVFCHILTNGDSVAGRLRKRWFGRLYLLFYAYCAPAP